MENQQNSSRMTLITLVSAIVGFLTLTSNRIFCSLYLIILFLPKYKQVSDIHSWIKIATLTSTTFVFGLINGFSYNNLSKYFTENENAQLPVFSIYLSLMTVYHYFQFQLINNFHHKTLQWQSFLIYHSKNYTIANAFTLVQHVITRYYFQFQYKSYHSLMLPALVISILGQSLRIAAFFTCKSNFTHLIRFRKDKEHHLITNGVYSFFRHPSYTGYFYFSVFSQLFLGNILSTILFFIVLRNFFSERIEYEQETLIDFFPQYKQYRKKTHILIPFVKNPIFQKKQEPQQEVLQRNQESKSTQS